MPFRQTAENCRRRGGSGGRGVSAMDGATEATWTYLRRPLTPDPPRHPSAHPLLTLTLIRRVQGCKPCRNPPPQQASAAGARARPHHASTSAAAASNPPATGMAA
ncbi:hypothetical protein C1922_03825 [Stenotrophomonas sp. ZAC14D2_NAIMI4_7]|nr:hypothetical protein C1922_03825 [Stenotrophomonas sp. ZAC14D2_NAIMI4_7]